jgi:uncharacterized protein (DUF305 family)
MAVAASAMLFGGACASPSPGTASSEGPAAKPAASLQAPPSDFGGTDLAWVELMIPMDEQVLPVLDLVAQRATDPSFRNLAAELRGVYDAELPRLRALSDRAGLPTDSPHKGHKMPGLVDGDRLAAIRTSSGAEFERQAADCLREHLDQLASLAKSELTNGTSQAVKEIARQVADSRAGASVRLRK